MTSQLPLLAMATAAIALAACSPSASDNGSANVDAISNEADRNLGLEPTDAEIVANSTENEAEAAAAANTLTANGLGSIVVGRAVPADLTELTPRISDNCRMYQDKARPGLNVMTDGKGVVQTINVQAPARFATAAGIAPGATEASLRAAYPDLRAQPNDNGGTDFFTGDGLRFTVAQDGKVGEIYGGRQPFLGYVEGCA